MKLMSGFLEEGKFNGEIFSGHNRLALLPFLYHPNSYFSVSTVLSPYA